VKEAEIGEHAFRVRLFSFPSFDPDGKERFVHYRPSRSPLCQDRGTLFLRMWSLFWRSFFIEPSWSKEELDSKFTAKQYPSRIGDPLRVCTSAIRLRRR